MTMKISLLTTAFAGFGLAILPLHAEDASTDKAAKPTQKADAKNTASTTNTIPTYLVVFSGGG